MRSLNSQRFAAWVVVLVLAGGLGWVVYSSRSTPLLVVGDSLAEDAKDELHAMGPAAGYHVDLDAIPGATLVERMPRIHELATRRSGPLVIELGTNDVGHGVAVAELFARIDEAVAALVDVPCVVFVDVGLLTDKAENAAAFNLHLGLAVSQHANMHMHDWAAVLEQHPDWVFDGVHLQPEFRREYAEGVIDAVQADC